MDKIIKRAFLNSFATAVYIILIVSLIFSFQTFASKGDNIIIPITMLLLFVCSAAITGFLVFGKPAMLYLDGRKREAVLLLSYTLGLLVLITIVSLICLISYLK